MNLAIELSQPILSCIEKLYGTVNENQIQLQKTRKEFNGDITLVVFPFVKLAKKGPEQTGEEIGNLLVSEIDIVTGFNCVKGFLNLEIAESYWVKVLNQIIKEENFGNSTSALGRMMVEFSSPNTNKPLHLGHMRNIFLGHSVARILEIAGHAVEKTQIINDRGIHICKSMLAWQRFGNGETPASSGLKGDKLVGKYYVEFDKVLKAERSLILEKWDQEDFSETDENVTAEVQRFQKAAAEKEDDKAKAGILSKIKELASNQTPIMIEVKEMLKKWEAKDEEVYALWQKMNGWVYEGFDVTYKTMGVDFNQLYYESDTYLTGKKLVEEGLATGLFFKKEDGSVWVDLTEDGLDEKLLLRSDGTAVYMTQDLGTAYQRFKDYPDLNGIIYTVGNEQDYHFKVLFLILAKLGYEWAKNCYHLSYGMVELRNNEGQVGKMKSREGTVVDADDLMDEVIDKARAMTEERGHIDGMQDEERNHLYHMIGMGGLKYYLLKVDPKKSMSFNPEESVDLNGNTGPFIQYAHARIASLLNNAQSLNAVDETLSLLEAERTLIKQMADFPAIVEEAATNYSPAIIANYTYELVKLYNSFYQSVPILKEDNENIVNLRLQLSKSIGQIVKKGMYMLGIEVPNRM